MASIDRTEQDEPKQDTPEDMVVAAFSRCQNYPKERAGVLGLAQGLRKASDTMGAPMEQIVAACAAQSQYCPTDHDLLTVAREIRDERRRAVESKIDREKELREQYGPPEPFDWKVIDLVKARRERAEYNDLWSAAKFALNVTNGNWPSMGVIVEALKRLAYPKTAEQKQVMKAWERQ